MLVIGFFRTLFDNISGLVGFITDENSTLTTLFGSPTSVLDLLSVSLTAFLLVVLALHVFHLIKPVG